MDAGSLSSGTGKTIEKADLKGLEIDYDLLSKYQVRKTTYEQVPSIG